jgi:hypothetical protein
MARTSDLRTVLPVLLPGAVGLPDVLIGRAVLDLRDTPIDSAAGAAGLLRAVLGVLASHEIKPVENDRTSSPGELHEALKRARRILGEDHPEVAQAEKALAKVPSKNGSDIRPPSSRVVEPPTAPVPARSARRGRMVERRRSADHRVAIRQSGEPAKIDNLPDPVPLGTSGALTVAWADYVRLTGGQPSQAPLLNDEARVAYLSGRIAAAMAQPVVSEGSRHLVDLVLSRRYPGAAGEEGFDNAA